MGKNSTLRRWRQWLQTGVVAVLLLTLSAGLSAATLLPSGNAITDGQAILRYALPIENKPVRDLQNSLEDISNHLRGKQWSTINSDVKKAAVIVKNKQADILKGVPEAKQAQAQTLLNEIQTNVEALAIATEAKDKPQVQAERAEALAQIGTLEDIPFDNGTQIGYEIAKGEKIPIWNTCRLDKRWLRGILTIVQLIEN